RWATHGEVNKENAHPHTDCQEEIAIVHNGIIENYEELKNELSDHKFTSETDTEVVPHLLEEELKKKETKKEAVKSVEQKLEGSYAIVVLFETGEITAFKKGSPLAIGLAEEDLFLASDVTPFLEYTKDVIFLEDRDLVHIDEDFEIFNEGEKVEREVKEVEWDAEEASKEGFDHFMEKEIQEQSETVRRASFQDKSDLEKAERMMDEAEKIYLTGCGTSSYAASLGARYLREAGYNVEAAQSHQLEYRTDEITEDDLVIAISQSGETADLLSMLEDVKTEVLAIVNVVGSTLARESDLTLYINAGPEIGVASTKAFTAQLTVLKLLKLKKIGKLEEGRENLIKTAEKIEEVLDKNNKILNKLSNYLKDKEHVYYIGRSKGYDIARESALKLKELSYIHAESFPGGEFKHGTIALLEDGTPVVSFLKKEGFQDIYSNTKEAESRGADIISVGPENPGDFKFHIEVPEDPNREILETVCFQKLAYLTAVKLGHNPDKPRNLAKSVTVK
ncbi:MAG: glutamine--fructose-6-phosphate transaminase (isomerizing), partial [Candidatus Nanohaloarchaea archaeon]